MLTSEVVVRYRCLRQDVRAAREGGVEVVQDGQRVLGTVLLHQQMLQEELEGKGGEGGTKLEKSLPDERHQTAPLETTVCIGGRNHPKRMLNTLKRY